MKKLYLADKTLFSLLMTALFLLLGCGKDVNKALGNQVHDLEKRVTELERRSDQDAALIRQIQQDLLSRLSDLENQSQEDIDALEAEISLLNDSIDKGIAELYDPCGDYPGHFDEILLILNDGSIVAYFEDGGKRFLATLSDGNYQTTDKQKCNFSVENGEIL